MKILAISIALAASLLLPTVAAADSYDEQDQLAAIRYQQAVIEDQLAAQQAASMSTSSDSLVNQHLASPAPSCAVSWTIGCQLN